MGILDSIMTPVSEANDPLAEREKWLQMSQLFNSFTINPQDSRGYYESQEKRIDRQRNAEALNRKEAFASEKLASQTEQAMRLIGTEYPDIAQAIQGGFMKSRVIKAISLTLKQPLQEQGPIMYL